MYPSEARVRAWITGYFPILHHTFKLFMNSHFKSKDFMTGRGQGGKTSSESPMRLDFFESSGEHFISHRPRVYQGPSKAFNGAGDALRSLGTLLVGSTRNCIQFVQDQVTKNSASLTCSTTFLVPLLQWLNCKRHGGQYHDTWYLQQCPQNFVSLKPLALCPKTVSSALSK